MINAYFKWLKTFLALKVKKVDSFIAPIFDIHVNFLDILFLDKFTTILLALQLTSTILLLLTLNIFKAGSDNLIAFNNKVNSIAILLKL